MRIGELSIDFPEIEGASSRQIWYAEQLRNKYVEENYDRFQEIADMVSYSVDHRNLDYQDKDYKIPDYYDEFSDAEMAVLYGTSAGGIIMELKDHFEW